MVSLPELRTEKEQYETDLSFLIHEGELLHDKIVTAKKEQKLPPYAIAGMEIQMQELAGKVLRIHWEINRVVGKISDIEDTN